MAKRAVINLSNQGEKVSLTSEQKTELSKHQYLTSKHFDNYEKVLLYLIVRRRVFVSVGCCVQPEFEQVRSAGHQAHSG